MSIRKSQYSRGEGGVSAYKHSRGEDGVSAYKDTTREKSFLNSVSREFTFMLAHHSFGCWFECKFLANGLSLWDFLCSLRR